MEAVGLYIHVPFCLGKCPYCDFYSVYPEKKLTEEYLEAVKSRIRRYSSLYKRDIATVYFGGGTPNLIGYEGISEILKEIRENFNITEGAEITSECNPNSVTGEFFRGIKSAGVNRISMGLQSADMGELEFLGRKHSLTDVERAVKWARDAGIENISLDLMIGLEGQTKEKLKRSIDYCASLKVNHVSSYILKVEENTPFYKKAMELPDEDETAELYLFACSELEKQGYLQYEISNYAKKGFESRHNLIYWQGREYLGIGPAAHSFMEGRRFYFDRSLDAFIKGAEAVSDGEGGDFEEYLMLSLRLKEGLKRSECERKYEGGRELFDGALKKARRLPTNLIEADEEKISLKREGFLISNTIIGMLL